VALERLAEALAKSRPVSRATPPPAHAATAAGIDGDGTAPGLVFDRGALDGLREDLGAAALRDVIETFLAKMPSALAALRDAAARADAGAIRQAAHSIKGTSAMLGARTLAEHCAEIERLGRAADVPDAIARVAAVEASYRKIEAVLKTELARDLSGAADGKVA
jgi:HPt (histidine-containing phosphotransfer) domain-containing protein